MVKVAIPVADGLLSSRFEACTHCVIYEIGKRAISSSRANAPASVDPVVLSKWMEDMGITDVLVHRIEKALLDYFSGTKINLFVGLAINTPEQLLEEYLNGSLQSDAETLFEIK